MQGWRAQWGGIECFMQTLKIALISHLQVEKNCGWLKNLSNIVFERIKAILEKNYLPCRLVSCLISILNYLTSRHCCWVSSCIPFRLQAFSTCVSSWAQGWTQIRQYLLDASITMQYVLILAFEGFFWGFLGLNFSTNKNVVKLNLRILLYYLKSGSSDCFNLLEPNIPWWLILMGFPSNLIF